MPRTQHLVDLDPTDRQHLDHLVASGTHPARMLTRGRILLLADRHGGRRRRYDREIADILGCSTRTVARVRAAWQDRGRDAIARQPRATTTPFKLDAEQEAHVLAIARSTPPAGRARWTLRLIAGAVVEQEITEAICIETIRKTLKKGGPRASMPFAES